MRGVEEREREEQRGKGSCGFLRGARLMAVFARGFLRDRKFRSTAVSATGVKPGKLRVAVRQFQRGEKSSARGGRKEICEEGARREGIGREDASVSLH